VNVTHVVVIRYINDVALEVSTCLYTTSEIRAKAIARSFTPRTPRTIIAPSEKGGPYEGTLVECFVVGEVVWAPL
jgi:hypothetical protein